MSAVNSGRPVISDNTHSGKIKSSRVLSRYVKKNALFAMIFAVLGLWGLQVVFSYLAEVDKFSDTYTYIDALKYIAYRSPYFLEQFVPTGALLGAVVGLGLLANSSELIVMRAAGVSIYRIVSWVLQPAILFVLLALAVNQYVLPHTNVMANKIHEPDAKLLASVSGYWTLQQDVGNSSAVQSGVKPAPSQPIQNPSNSTIVFIDYADANGNIGEVKRWHLDVNNNLTAVSKASGGVYLPDGNLSKSSTANLSQKNRSDKGAEQYKWQLNDVSTLNLAKRAAITTPDTIPMNIVSGVVADKSAAISTTNEQQSAEFVLNSDPLVEQHTEISDVISLPIAPSSVYLLTRRAEDLSLTQLYEHKQFNQSQGTRSLEHELAFWQKLLSPFAILSLVIVACSFVFGSLRTHSLGLRIVVALLFGLLFSYMQDLTGFISLATGISPLLMVLFPIVGSAFLGLYLIKRQG